MPSDAYLMLCFVFSGAVGFTLGAGLAAQALPKRPYLPFLLLGMGLGFILGCGAWLVR